MMRLLSASAIVLSSVTVSALALAPAANAAPITVDQFKAEIVTTMDAFKAGVSQQPVVINFPGSKDSAAMRLYTEPNGALKMTSGDAAAVCRPIVNNTLTCYSKPAGKKKWEKITTNDPKIIKSSGLGVIDSLAQSAIETADGISSTFIKDMQFDKTVNGTTTTLAYGGNIAGSTETEWTQMWTTYTFTPTKMSINISSKSSNGATESKESITAEVTAPEKITYPTAKQIKK